MGAGGDDLLTSRPILASFEFLLSKPRSSLCLLTCLVATSIYVALPYNDLRRTQVALPPYSTSLTRVLESLQSDFDDQYLFQTDSVVLWGSNPGRGDLLSALEDVRRVLGDLRTDGDSCKMLKWQHALFSNSGEAVALPISIKLNSIGEQDECMPRVRTSLQSMVLRPESLHAALSSPSSVIQASYDHCDDYTWKHLCLSAPFFALLLLFGVGTLPRALTPFLSLLGSVHASRAVLVSIKYFWHDLNMTAPDTQVICMQWALCLDYSIFYWSRFSQERKQAAAGSSVPDSLMTTMQTSGLVIITSTVILAVAFLGASVYPDLNKIGYLASTLSLALGVIFVGFFSIAVPSVLASIFPNTFDEPAEGNRFAHITRRASTACKMIFKPIAAMATSKPWSYILPCAIILVSLPLATNLHRLQPNFDLARTDFADSVSEYRANQLWQHDFNASKVPMTLLLELPTASMSANQISCRLAETAISLTKGTPYEITASDIMSQWWNPHEATGQCLTEPLALVGGSTEVFVSKDQRKEKIVMFSQSKNPFSAEQGELIEILQYEIEKILAQDGNALAVHLYTPLAETMLLEKRYAAWVKVIGVATIVLICCILAAVFSSVLVGLKMIVTIAIPILAEYGLTVAVYQHGWLEWAGVHETGGVKWTLPYTTSCFLIALAMDYDIFLFARVYERRRQGYDNTSAVRLAAEETGPVISLAGTLMVLAFVFVFLSPVTLISQIGFLYSFGVAFDVYVVRLWLAPGTLCFLEDMNYWPAEMPKVSKSYADSGTLLDSLSERHGNYASCESIVCPPG